MYVIDTLISVSEISHCVCLNKRITISAIIYEVHRPRIKPRSSAFKHPQFQCLYSQRVTCLHRVRNIYCPHPFILTENTNNRDFSTRRDALSLIGISYVLLWSSASLRRHRVKSQNADMWHNFVCFQAKRSQGNFRRRKEIFNDSSCRAGVLEELDSALVFSCPHHERYNKSIKSIYERVL
jgi:hypothetical protein